MKSSPAIISFLTLGTTLTACSDPIVGDWTGVHFTFEEYSVPIPYVYEGEEFIGAINLSIEADLKGTFYYSSQGESFTDTIIVTDNGDSNYTIDLANDNEDLDCNLADAQLTCTDEGGGEIRFEKGDPK